MRKLRLTFCLTFVLILLSVSPLLAQCNRASGAGYYPGMDLTSEQIDKIQDLRLQFQKETISLRMELQAGFLEMRSLVYKNAGQDRVDAARNEIYLLQEEMETRFQDHQEDIKVILTDEQTAIFERWGGLGLGASNGMGYGFAGGYGRGFGRGRGAGFGGGRGAGFAGNRGAGYSSGRGLNMGPGLNRASGFNRGWRCPGLRNW